MNGHDLSRLPLLLIPQPAVKDDEVIQTTRVGISQAVDVPWRFYLKGNKYVSK